MTLFCLARLCDEKSLVNGQVSPAADHMHRLEHEIVWPMSAGEAHWACISGVNKNLLLSFNNSAWMNVSLL
jgi:hypothetical protein